MSAGLVLTVGENPNQLEKLNTLLRAAGHVVESASSITYAVHLFLAGDFDVVVLCHSLSLHERARLISAVRASGSYVSIIMVSPPWRDAAPNQPASHLRELLRNVESALKRSVKRKPIAAEDPGRRPTSCPQHAVLYVAADAERVSLRRRQFENSGFALLAATNLFEALKVVALGVADAVVIEETNRMNSHLAVQKMRETNQAVPLLLCACPSALHTRNAKMFDRCLPAGASVEALTSAIRELLLRNQVPPGVSTMALLHFASEVRH